MTETSVELKKGAKVTAFDRFKGKRQPAKIVHFYEEDFHGTPATRADVQFADKHIQYGHLVGLLRPIVK